jgi:hypothetical protein
MERTHRRLQPTPVGRTASASVEGTPSQTRTPGASLPDRSAPATGRSSFIGNLAQELKGANDRARLETIAERASMHSVAQFVEAEAGGRLARRRHDLPYETVKVPIGSIRQAESLSEKDTDRANDFLSLVNARLGESGLFVQRLKSPLPGHVTWWSMRDMVLEVARLSPGAKAPTHYHPNIVGDLIGPRKTPNSDLG